MGSPNQKIAAKKAKLLLENTHSGNNSSVNEHLKRADLEISRLVFSKTLRIIFANYLRSYLMQIPLEAEVH